MIASRHALAPTAPMPEDASRCRWCGAKLKALLDGEPADYCQHGCAKNDMTPYTGHCWECGRSFQTGRPLRDAPLCFECERKEIQAVTAGAAPGPEYYHFRKIGRGGYRSS